MATTSSEEAPGGAGEKPAAPWQFSLRELLIVSTAASVLAAIAAWRGPGALVLSLGLLLAFANSCGWLSRWQSAKARPKWLGVGWLLFVLSLFSPAAQGCNREPISGAQLAWTCVTIEAEAVTNLATRVEDRSKFRDVFRVTPLKALAPHGFFAAIIGANVFVLLVPALWWLWRRERAQWMFGWIYVGACLAWTLTWSPDNRDMLWGYYVWSASFLVVLSSLRIPWSQQRVAWCALALWFYSGGFGEV